MTTPVGREDSQTPSDADAPLTEAFTKLVDDWGRTWCGGYLLGDGYQLVDSLVAATLDATRVAPGLREALAKAIEAEWPIQWENDHDGTARSFSRAAEVLLEHPLVRAALSQPEAGIDVELAAAWEERAKKAGICDEFHCCEDLQDIVDEVVAAARLTAPGKSA